MEHSLAGKTIVVTGATSGIGLATADILAAQGAGVIGVGRSEQRCREAEARLRADHPNVQIEYCVADLSLQRDVRRLAAEIGEKLAARGVKALDGLVNNAGTVPYWFTLTAEGFETQWAVNHLAGFLLTHELLPLLEAAPAARVVTVSSESHFNTQLNWDDIQLRRSYNCLLAYQQTKLANVLFTAELNRRLGPKSTVRAFAADPGLVRTEIGHKGNPGIVGWVWSKRAAAGISPEESGRNVAYLVAEPSIQDVEDVYWKELAPKTPSLEARDVESARRLWAMSARMCGM
jgi:NAD(P)-dependent dehydrogenase (short-subunit alcohol dehydrogenase family)